MRWVEIHIRGAGALLKKSAAIGRVPRLCGIRVELPVQRIPPSSGMQGRAGQDAIVSEDEGPVRLNRHRDHQFPVHRFLALAADRKWLSFDKRDFTLVYTVTLINTRLSTYELSGAHMRS